MTKYPSQLQDKFNLRLPDGMKDAIAERAKENGRSINSEIVQILQDALNEKLPMTDKDNPNSMTTEEFVIEFQRQLEEKQKEILDFAKSMATIVSDKNSK